MTEQATPDRDTLLRKAYSMATSALREAHRDEFKRLQSEAARELGVDWSPSLTPVERAEAEVTRLLSEFPDLKTRLFGEPTA